MQGHAWRGKIFVTLIKPRFAGLTGLSNNHILEPSEHCIFWLKILECDNYPNNTDHSCCCFSLQIR